MPRSLDDPIGLEATGTHANLPGRPVHEGPHVLQVRKPAPPGLVVGVAYSVAGHGSLTTDIADAGHKLKKPKFELCRTIFIHNLRKLLTQGVSLKGSFGNRRRSPMEATKCRPLS